MLVDALLSEPTCDTRQARALVLGCLCIFAMGGLVFGTLGYNGLVIAILGDALSPLLMSIARMPP